MPSSLEPVYISLYGKRNFADGFKITLKQGDYPDYPSSPSVIIRALKKAQGKQNDWFRDIMEEGAEEI